MTRKRKMNDRRVHVYVQAIVHFILAVDVEINLLLSALRECVVNAAMARGAYDIVIMKNLVGPVGRSCRGGRKTQVIKGSRNF